MGTKEREGQDKGKPWSAGPLAGRRWVLVPSCNAGRRSGSRPAWPGAAEAAAERGNHAERPEHQAGPGPQGGPCRSG